MKSSVYRRIRTEVARFIDYCRSEENCRISVALLVLITLMSGIQIGDYLSCRKQYIYNDKGELVAFVRVSKDSAESIPLHVSISEGNEKKSKDLVINIKGNKAGDDNNPEKADEGDSLETVINRIASDLSDSSDRIIYFPLREKNARISWEKQKNYSIILIPLLFPLSFAAIRESRKASEKQKKEQLKNSVKRSLPRFSSQLLLMLESGLILEEAFKRIALMYEKSYVHDDFKEIIIGINHQCEYTSDNIICALEKKSKELKIRELLRLSGILENGQKKGTDLCSKLTLESELLWNERKHYAEERGRAAEVKLSFPLALLLIVLIVVTAAPALMEM